MTLDYKKLAIEAYEMRITALRMEQAAQKGDGQAVFVAYCDMLVSHEKIRDIVAGRR